MKIIVGENDRSDDLGASISEQAAALASHPDAVPELRVYHSALILREAEDASDYVQKLLDLLVLKAGTSTGDFYIQRRPGPLGSLMAKLKQKLWKLMLYQHERMVLQQNSVNKQFAVALQFVREDYEREIDALKNRLAALEQQASSDGHTPPHDATH